MAKAAEAIVGWGTGSTSYDAFLEQEGIPVIRGLLDGSGINTSYIAIDCYLLEIPPGGSLNAERYMYECAGNGVEVRMPKR